MIHSHKVFQPQQKWVFLTGRAFIHLQNLRNTVGLEDFDEDLSLTRFMGVSCRRVSRSEQWIIGKCNSGQTRIAPPRPRANANSNAKANANANTNINAKTNENTNIKKLEQWIIGPMVNSQLALCWLCTNVLQAPDSKFGYKYYTNMALPASSTHTAFTDG